MTVIELITLLLTLPQDAEVLIDDPGFGLASIVEVEPFERNGLIPQIIVHTEAS